MNTVLAASAQSGDVAGAVGIVGKMQRSSCIVQRSSLNLLLKACAKSGDGQAAELCFGQIIRMGHTPNRESFCGVILSWVKQGSLERSEVWIDKLFAAGFVAPKGFCRQLVRKAMSASLDCGPAAHAERVTRWLHRVRAAGIPIDRPTVNLMMGVVARSGDVEGTEKWVHFMHKAGITPNRSTMSALVTASRRAEDHTRAEKWLARMEQMGFAPGGLGSDDEAESADLDDGTPTTARASSPIATPPESPLSAPSDLATLKQGFRMLPRPHMLPQPRRVPAALFTELHDQEVSTSLSPLDMLPKKITLASLSHCGDAMAPPGLDRMRFAVKV